jgi:hypothetical protein
MCAPGFGALLEHHHIFHVGVELLEADRRGQAGGAGADDDDVVLHRFARAVLGEDLVVVAAALQPHHAVGGVAAAGEDQHAAVAAAGDLADQLDAVHVRQAQVHDAQVRPLGHQAPQHRGPVSEGLGREVELAQRARDQAHHLGVVVDDEDERAVGLSHGPGAAPGRPAAAG